jgi:NarL family two-component system response regulator LiaR
VSQTVKKITAREKDVGVLIAEGLTNIEIGQRLDISKYTVKKHVSNIMQKLRISRRSQIAAIAVGYGWNSSSNVTEHTIQRIAP